MTTMTVAELEKRIGVSVDEHLIRSMEIPVISGRAQRQGDVMFLPSRKAATVPLSREGVAVVRGENGGNTHAVHADQGAVFYAPNLGVGQILGWLTVAEGGVAILSHPEHGFMAFGPGRYEARRQREQADEVRIVAD